MPESRSGNQPSARVFISHASGDRDIAERVAGALADRALQVWMATGALQVGDNYAEQIYRQLRNCDFVVVLLSQASLQSVHVRRELNIAIDLRRQVLPFALQPGIVGSSELPLDWRYWLGIVQVLPYSTADEAADLVAARASGPKTRRIERKPRAPAVEVDADAVEAAVRASLIQVATEGRPFRMVVDRCRHLRCGRERIEAATRHFKQSGLITYTEPLSDSTTIVLAV